MSRLSSLTLLLAAPLAACDFDNFSPPQSTLQGRIVFEGQPVNVRQNAIQLELWQDGYALRREIPVFVRQDGTFSASLFDGAYKLVRKQNNGPWENDSDTIRFEIRRTHTLDVAVNPFFVIRNDNLQRNNSILTATFDVAQVAQNRELERIALYVGTTAFVDARYNTAKLERAATNGDLGTNTLSLDLSSASQNRAYLYARLGVKTGGVEEMIYTATKKIELQ
jgi:hypothetical protein